MNLPFTITTRIGPVEAPPGPAELPFTQPQRRPGWHSDATVQTLDLGNFERVVVNPVEALAVGTDGHPIPFPIPSFHGKPFEEPDRHARPEEWLEFVRHWILGHPIVERNSREFYLLLLELAQLARNYNASLYRLRRLHFYQKAANDGKPGPLPPRNPHGESDDPEPGDPTRFAEQVRQAEADWKKSTAEIDAFIDGEHHGLKIATADMVEMNRYIVSMRVILAPHGPYAGIPRPAHLLAAATPVPPPPAGGSFHPFGAGTSSSLVSISSNFSTASKRP